MANAAKKTTLEDLQEIVKEIGEAQKATEKSLKRVHEAREEGEKSLRESLRKVHEAQAKTERELQEANGNFNNKWGTFMENLVKGDLTNMLNKRGIKVQATSQNMIVKNPDGTEWGEFDLIAHNGDEVVIVEVKTTLTKGKVDSFLEKITGLKNLIQAYRDKTVYGAVAFLEDAQGAAKYSEKCGLFVIKAPGGSAQVSVIANGEDFNPRAF